MKQSKSHYSSLEIITQSDAKWCISNSKQYSKMTKKSQPIIKHKIREDMKQPLQLN